MIDINIILKIFIGTHVTLFPILSPALINLDLVANATPVSSLKI